MVNPQNLSATENPGSQAYRVLARKYRPTTFADLVGQDVLVEVLTNGMKKDRLPHAFIFTGIRGVGKTTTARLLARALNCTGRDIQVSVEPCGTCEQCISIAEDRNIDVIEMDAASRTGVDDIRDVIEAVKYKAVSAKFKIYIIDEVHMLSKSAFNALLKTLEEPPKHVKFIFATTEIRKVPKTVLSRCMRFDLQRVDLKTIAQYLMKVAAQEGFTIEENAVQLLANAADGSMRDGISLLDKALTLCQEKVTVDIVISMLGLAEISQVIKLFKDIMQGNAEAALTSSEEQYAAGVDPLTLTNDLLSITHTISTLKVSTELANGLHLPEAMITECIELAQKLTMPTLTRVWQILLKGVSEVQFAPMPIQACQMLLLRVAYASTLPTPDEIIKGRQPTNTPTAKVIPLHPENKAVEIKEVQPLLNSSLPSSFKEVVELVGQNKEPLLYAYLLSDVYLVKYEPGKIECRLGDRAPKNLATRLSKLLKQWTNYTWEVILSNEPGMPSLSEQAATEKQQLEEATKQHPLVDKALKAFPGATIKSIESTADD